MEVPTISLQELNAALTSGEDLVLLDIREPFELEISKLENVVHIPMGELANRVGELNPDSNIVVVCRTGNRSAHVTAFLQQVGFKHVRNMAGGMNGWAREVDPKVAMY